ncbi:MAG: NAD(P)-binding protein, partial [Acidiferrobacteraceae bacterium]|nr:NAD(P)-binding protein [Acidiferrobacteraceae bacterium]
MSDIRSTCEVAIVGAGPAGLAAACVLAGKGVDVVVLDEQQAPGGQVFRGIEKVNATRPSDLNPLGASYGAGIKLARRFRESGAYYRPGTSV